MAASPSATMKRPLPASPARATDLARTQSQPSSPFNDCFSQDMLPSYSDPIAHTHVNAATSFREQPASPARASKHRPRVRRKISAAGDSLRSSSEDFDDRASISSIGSGTTSRSGSISWKSCTPYSPFSTSSSSNTAQTSLSLDSPVYYKTPLLNIDCDFRNGSDAQPRSAFTSSLPSPTFGAFTSSLTQSPEGVQNEKEKKRNINKKKLSLVVPTSSVDMSAVKSCPLSPADHGSLSTLPLAPQHGPLMRRQNSHQEQKGQMAGTLGSTLRGQMSMRRRTSLPKLNLGLTTGRKDAAPLSARPRLAHLGDSARLMTRAEFIDPSDQMGSTSSDAFPYQNGPVEIMPGLYLGSEQNAKDPQVLRDFGIGSVLNVAKEVECPWLGDPNSIMEEDEEEVLATPADQNLPTVSIEAAPFSPSSKAIPAISRARTLQTLLIRPTSSTPNLQAAFASSSRTKLPENTRKSRQTTLADFESINRQFPANPRTGCPPLDYVKLPWNHDQSDLCLQFPQIVAHLDSIRDRGGKVLVHCQCGVSRSASTVIGYVMARYLDSDGRKLGMHDAYTFVKDKSMWVSPNMGLIYQLVEWDKKLKGLPPSEDSDAEMADLRTTSDEEMPDGDSPHSSIDAVSDRSSELATPNATQPLTAVYVDGMLSPMAKALAIDHSNKTISQDCEDGANLFLG